MKQGQPSQVKSQLAPPLESPVKSKVSASKISASKVNSSKKKDKGFGF